MLMTLPFEGPYYPSFPILLALNGVQFALWYFVQNYVDSYIVMGLLAWFNSCTLFYSLSTFIHENSHGLILGKCERNCTPAQHCCLPVLSATAPVSDSPVLAVAVSAAAGEVAEAGCHCHA